GRQLILHDVTRDQDAVFFDENQLVATGVRGTQPEQARGYATQVEFGLAVEGDIRFAELHAREQFLIHRRTAAEGFQKLVTALFQFLLLRGGTDQDRVRREGCLTRGVLRMEVRGGQVQHRVF